jgi:hypothetical protein
MVYKVFANNAILTAAEVNSYLMRQVIVGVANASERDAIQAPQEGMHVYDIARKRMQRRVGNAWVDQAPGLYSITPASVAGAGVTKVEGGAELAGATAASLNGIFSSLFSEYQLLINITHAAQGVNLSLRGGGADAEVAGTYDYKLFWNNGATPAIAQGTSNSQTLSVNAAVSHTVDLKLFNPGAAVKTDMLIDSWHVTANDAASYMAKGGMRHKVATAYDGISLKGGSGMTGRVRVYGYA